MSQAGVDRQLIIDAIKKMDVTWVLPFRFISAAKFAPDLEPYLEEAMFRAVKTIPKLKGCTALVIDHSGSMQYTLSSKSDLTRLEAASAMAILVKETCEDVRVYSFADNAEEIPSRRGFALRDAIFKAKDGASYGGKAVEMANTDGYDRIIVLTDGQWHTSKTKDYFRDLGNAIDVSPDPLTRKAYMINIAPHQNGVGYGKWITLDGWSEAIMQYIASYETEF